MRKICIIISIILCCSWNVQAQLIINDTFANPDETEFMTRDVFVVWWDKDFDYSTTVDALLDQIIAYRVECLDELNMMDPPSVEDGFYQNIYLHGDGGYFDDNGWGNGVGTDINGYPFYTMPVGLFNNIITVAHEIFHIFQYNANSSGFEYANESQWFIEASANWYGARQDFTAQRAFIEAESLVRMPHVPLWLSFGNYPDEYPDNWQRYVHQYALALHLYYLTEIVGISPNVISEGFYMNVTERPQEYLYNEIGSATYRNHFIDWCARMTNDFDFITEQQRNANEAEYLTYADLDDDNEFTEIFDETGSDGWYTPSSEDVTNAWSFNTYKLENNSNTSYTFEIDGETTGIFGSASYFKGKVLVKDTSGNSTFYDLMMTDETTGSLSIDVLNTDAEIYLIIASMPEYFEEITSEFQQFPYQIRITNNTLIVVENVFSNLKASPNPVNELLLIEIENYEKEIEIAVFSALGRQIITKTFYNSKEFNVDFTNLTEGIYFVKVLTNNKTKTLKLIKN